MSLAEWIGLSVGLLPLTLIGLYALIWLIYAATHDLPDDPSDPFWGDL